MPDLFGAERRTDLCAARDTKQDTDGVTLRVDRCEGFKNFAPINLHGRWWCSQSDTESAVRHLVFSGPMQTIEQSSCGNQFVCLGKVNEPVRDGRYRFCGLGHDEDHNVAPVCLKTHRATIEG